MRTSAGPFRILVLEDEPSLRRNVGRMLTLHGYVSGNDEADFRAELEASEPIFLAKPFTAAELAEAVEKALG